MQGAFSLILLYLVGTTYASVPENGFQYVQEKPEYYANPRTFGRAQEPAFDQYQRRAYSQSQAYTADRTQANAANIPQAYADNSRQTYSTVDRPQAPVYDRLQAPQYGQPQASAYAQPEASPYNRLQLNENDAIRQAEYEKRYRQYAQEERELYAQKLADYNERKEEAGAKDALTPAPTKPTTPPKPRSFCPGNCPKWCLPHCNHECCNPKPPPMPEYLQRQQLTASACEGHKLKIHCPNRSDRIIMYSTFYGREKDGNSTCHHDVLPSEGTCNDQEHHVNEKVFNLCGHENRCIVAVNNKFLAKDNTTICPGLYKYLKVIYKCHQKPKIFKICPLPCKKPKNCFPRCSSSCCSPTPKPKPMPAADPTPPPPAKTCPAPCPSKCKPPCTPQCCYKDLSREEIRSYIYGNKPGQRPYPDDTNAYQDSQSPYDTQSNYYSNPYSPYQAPQSPLNDYDAQRSTCPAGCSQTCSNNCPPQCCLVTPGPQFGGQGLNYYG